MGLWIHLNSEHLVAWERSLLAYLMLCVEGQLRVTSIQVAEREKSLEWLLKLMALPMQPSIVTLIGSLTASEAKHLGPSLFVTIRHPEGNRLGAFHPSTPPNDMFPSPVCEGMPRALNGQALLSRGSDGSYTRVGRRCPLADQEVLDDEDRD
jgi:hypothetical protein